MKKKTIGAIVTVSAIAGFTGGALWADNYYEKEIANLSEQFVELKKEHKTTEYIKCTDDEAYSFMKVCYPIILERTCSIEEVCCNLFPSFNEGITYYEPDYAKPDFIEK